MTVKSAIEIEEYFIFSEILQHVQKQFVCLQVSHPIECEGDLGTPFKKAGHFKNGKDFRIEQTKMKEYGSYFKTADKSKFLTGISNLVSLNLWGKEGC